MFEDIIGNERAKSFLKNTVEEANISHAYLFVGKSGIGKKKMALEFTSYLLNTSNLESCVDFKYICKEKDSKNITVASIRENIINDVYEAPVSSSRKIYIIDEAEFLNEASQNALLKTIEEPPSYVTIILVCSNISSILPTILSRVTLVNFEKLTKGDISKYIELNYSENVSSNIINFCDGSIGDLQELLKEENKKTLSDIEELYSLMVSKDVVKSIMYKDNIDFSNKYALEYLEFLMYINSKYENVDVVERAKNRLKNNGNTDIVIDNCVIKCIDNM